MSSRGAVERELKFADADHGELRERLMALEAESQGSPALEDNWIFDSEGKLSASGSVLRLRVDRRGSMLTFEGSPSFDGFVKVRTELNLGIDDVDRARSILECLGFSIVRRYQKYREEWYLGSIRIGLAHTPIGDFAEFAGEGCETVARRSGFEPETAERRNYLRLYEDYLKEHPEAPPNMVFP